MKIKVKEIVPGCIPKIYENGDWIDLIVAEDVSFNCPQAHKLHVRNKANTDANERTRDVVFDFKLIPLGIAMEIPEGYEAHLLPRSSTYKRYGIIQSNSTGIIDNSYSGDNDEWKFPAVALKKTTIQKGKRIAQFRVTLSQKATIWQKIKWLFTSHKIELVKVDSLNNPDRKGIGEGTGE